VSVQIDPARHVPHAVEDRLRHRYRHSRAEQRRPLFPETPRGWLLLIGLLLVPIFTVTLLLGGHSSADPGGRADGPAIVDANHASAASSSGAGSDPSGAVAGETDTRPATSDPGAIARDPTMPPETMTGYQWPLAQPVITNPFGPSDWGDFFYRGVRIHDGVDMASWCGDNVMAAHDGTVLAVGTQYDDYMGWVESLQPYKDLFDRKHWWSSLPLTIVIDDGNGFRSIYAHESKITVKVGQKVRAGQVIGYEGATGNATGCHVHYGLFSPDETAVFALDPDIVAHDSLPAHEVARVNPLYVLPFRCEIEEMRELFPDLADPCPPLPTPTPR
jgi:murein DD-endopeptidase MepM/ murein hydrolase activator NlpD